MQSENQSQEKQITEEDVKKYREQRKNYYDSEIPLLKKQKEYEVLLADIEEARAKRLAMTYRIAQMMAGPQEEPSDEEKAEMMQQMQEKIQNEGEESAKTSRQLKKDKA